ncbi:MAG TPA: FecR domain-containing protein [Candidatus Polarisedimenticolia bacterium]|nr:FecR domain-containing protein [Candidatus Polarisedimenticolia bacterium]
MKLVCRLMSIVLPAILLAPGAASRAGAPQAAGAQPAAWSAVAASGSVETTHGGQCVTPWRAVSRGDSVPALSRVRTHERSRATFTRGGDIVLVSARSEIFLPDESSAPAMSIRQTSGKALYQFEPRTDGKVEIVTPYLVAGVKGTVFSVIVDPEYSSVSVVSGHVEVRSLASGEIVDLFAGDMALLESKDGEMRVHRDREERTEISRMDLSPGAKGSRKETSDLVRTAAKTELTWEPEKTDLWEDFADETWLDQTREVLLEQEPALLKDDRVLTKAEEDIRNVLCVAGKCP